MNIHTVKLSISERPQGVATLHFLERLPHNHCWMNKWRIILTEYSISTNKIKSLFRKKIKELDKSDLFMWILFSPNKCIHDRKCLRPVFPWRWTFSSSDFRMLSTGKEPRGERPCAVTIKNSSLAMWLSWLSIVSYKEGLGVQFSVRVHVEGSRWMILSLSLFPSISSFVLFIFFISLLCKCSLSLFM